MKIRRAIGLVVLISATFVPALAANAAIFFRSNAAEVSGYRYGGWENGYYDPAWACRSALGRPPPAGRPITLGASAACASRRSALTTSPSIPAPSRPITSAISSRAVAAQRHAADGEYSSAAAGGSGRAFTE